LDCHAHEDLVMRGLTSDLTDAMRSVARTPLLAAVIIGWLAIGIGLNTVVFSWIQVATKRGLARTNGA
jgi:hypothetical protein